LIEPNEPGTDSIPYGTANIVDLNEIYILYEATFYTDKVWQ